MTANLLRNDTRYPNTSTADPGDFIDELTEQGFFDFKFQQPILQPSQRKTDLHDRQDEMQIARLDRHTKASDLKKEVVEAFFGVLHNDLLTNIDSLKHRSALLQANIDSMKVQDGVASEETWLESTSLRLDAELELIDVQNQYKQQHRTLLSLLDMSPTNVVEPEVPMAAEPPDESRKKQIVAMWSESIPIQKAAYNYNKADRAASFAASAHGLNATLDADYSLGRGNVEATSREDRDINTNSWGVSLNFTYPIWDGGSSGAAVKAARLEAERSRLEYEQTKRAAQAEIVNLINQIDVSFRKLKVLEQKIDIHKNKLEIARSRFGDGQISELTYLTDQVSYLESRDNYLEELKNFYLVRIDLESKFLTDVT
jgi:outer membrane protein TolC